MDMKRCKKCGVEKPDDGFYKLSKSEKRDSTCKDCVKARARARRFDPEKREAILAYDRKRGARQGPEYLAQYRAANMSKYKAHSAVTNAVRDGRLERPNRCDHCGTDCKPHGHHEDYNKPLEVIWLCAECHRNLHAIYETVGRKIPA